MEINNRGGEIVETFLCSFWSPAIAFLLGAAVIIEMAKEYKEDKE